MRRVLLLLALSLAGCSWGWDAFEPAAAGVDAGARDAGTRDGGADGGPLADADAESCEAPFHELCDAASLCVRPARDRAAPCCEIGACLERGERPLAWARRIGADWGALDGAGGEAHWGAPTPRYPLTSVVANGVPARADGRAEVSAVWNDVGLILWIRGDDDVLYAPTGFPDSDWAQMDAVEIFIDAAPDSPGPPDATLDADENELGVVIRPGVGVEHMAVPDTSSWDNALAFRRAADGEWGVEVVINWADTGRGVPRPGDVIGLDVGFRDEDDDGTGPTLWRWSRCDLAAPAALPLVVLAGDAEVPRFADCDQTCTSGLCAPAGYPCEAPLACAP